MNFPSIINRGEFFSTHYLEAVISGDLNDLRKQWEALEGKDMPTARFGVRSMRAPFFDARARAAEATDTASIQPLNDIVLDGLGFTVERQTIELVRNTTDTIDVPVAAQAETSTGLLLVAIEAGMADSLDDILDTTEVAKPGRLVSHVFRQADKKAVHRVQPAVNEIFSADEPPRYVLVAAGRFVILAERAKWAEGRFLAVDLDAALERNDTKAKGELETIAALFSADALLPGGPAASDEEAGGQSILDELTDKSQKHAVGVSKELRHGIRQSIELLANEVVDQRLSAGKAVYSGKDAIDAKDLTRQSLRWLYRLVVLLYAESRPELGVLPVNDEAYLAGYSLDRLRELTLVELDTERSRNGSHLHESLNLLFELVNNGYHADHAQTTLDLFNTPQDHERTSEQYLEFPGLDAALFDPQATPLLNSVTLRNETLQQVLKLLTYTEGKGKSGTAGFISYAQLGINQLGAVYEGLMAYSGFFADEPLYEVAKGGDPEGGTWMLPVDKADEYEDDVFVTTTDERTGAKERVRHEKGSFVFRLSGRDRQRSASYYTPEVLTRCVVKHALAELLGLDDYAPENGTMGITTAAEILDITICEPALGSGAFANEAINQLAAEYLRRAQIEQQESLDPERYRFELQKVKAHFALHQTYGVDLNATAVELAEVSLWLNAMYPGLQAPWFGLQLRQGNSLIGCRRATWTASQIQDKPWANTKKGQVKPPEDRKLNVALNEDEIHHFLFPGHGWAAVADRKEAKELRPNEVAELKQWRKTILAAPNKTDEKRLLALAQAVEDTWKQAAERIRLIQKGLRRPIDLYGNNNDTTPSTTSRAQAEAALNDENSPLGRLRTLMDAWIGLWFWPLDTDVKPPTWNEWLAAAEELARPEDLRGPTGQLDLFDDLDDLVAAQQRLAFGQSTVTELREQHQWLDIALDAAESEAAWHWDLEFAPIFERGGFDLQVGNPPWVRLDWSESDVLAEMDSWWGLDLKATAQRKVQRRAELLSTPAAGTYISELGSASSVAVLLSCSNLWPVLSGLRSNLYMSFMAKTWSNAQEAGVIALLHQDAHMTDPRAGQLRRECFQRLRLRAEFYNELKLFDEVLNNKTYSLNIYARPTRSPGFRQVCWLFHPDTLDGSLKGATSASPPGVQFAEGGWDLRPDQRRVVHVDIHVLTAFCRLLEERSSSPLSTRILRPVTSDSLDAVRALSKSQVDISSVRVGVDADMNETHAKNAGEIRWDVHQPEQWSDVLIQGSHFGILMPVETNPRWDAVDRYGFSEKVDFSTLPSGDRQVIPRNAYRMSESTQARAVPESAYRDYILIHREFVGPTVGERTYQASIFPSATRHVHSCLTTWFGTPEDLVIAAGVGASIVADFLFKMLGAAHIGRDVHGRMPLIPHFHKLSSAIILRTLRLNCISHSYSRLWSQMWNPEWLLDRWALSTATSVKLGDVAEIWHPDVVIRSNHDRRLVQVELDALTAIALGLSEEELFSAYRTQFPVLRKYESRMAFDTKGRKLASHSRARSAYQTEIQTKAKAGHLPQEWQDIWSLYEKHESGEVEVGWGSLYDPPFLRVDREAEMRHAYREFQRRLDTGEYGASE